MASTYCTTDDVEFVISVAGVTACLDDDETGRRSAKASTWLATAIAWSASEINEFAQHQYRTSELLASNAWLSRANAYMAVEILCKRRSNPVPESIAEEVQKIREKLVSVRWGRTRIPDQLPSADHTPAVSNFRVEPRKYTNPVRVVEAESTGDAPPSRITRHTSGNYSPY